MSKGVWVLAEQREGNLQNVALELLGEGKKIASELKEEVCAVLIGHQVGELIDRLAHYGAG